MGPDQLGYPDGYTGKPGSCRLHQRRNVLCDMGPGLQKKRNDRYGRSTLPDAILKHLLGARLRMLQKSKGNDIKAAGALHAVCDRTQSAISVSMATAVSKEYESLFHERRLSVRCAFLSQHGENVNYQRGAALGGPMKKRRGMLPPGYEVIECTRKSKYILSYFFLAVFFLVAFFVPHFLPHAIIVTPFQ